MDMFRYPSKPLWNRKTRMKIGATVHATLERQVVTGRLRLVARALAVLDGPVDHRADDGDEENDAEPVDEIVEPVDVPGDGRHLLRAAGR
jgi:hypothetical protein